MSLYKGFLALSYLLCIKKMIPLKLVILIINPKYEVVYEKSFKRSSSFCSHVGSR